MDLTITTTTADDLRTELLSFDELYKNGWDLHLTQDSNYMTNSTNNNNHYSRIPLRYNHGKKGGWWLDYVIRDDNNNKRILQANNSNLELEDTQDEMQMLRTQTYDVTSARDAYNKVLESTQIGNVTQGNEHRAKCVKPQSEFRGVKAGLKNNKAKLTAREFHERYGHIGHCENCQVCKMAKGNMRRITKKIAPHTPALRAHTFTMDMITLSHRYIKGNKYILQMRDKMSSCIYAIGEMLLLCISKTSLFSFNPDIVTHELVTLEQIIQLENLFSLKQSWPRLRGAHNRPPLLVSVRLSPW